MTTTNPYQVLGPAIPPMLGRMELMRWIEKHLLKPTPDHVSVVGPAHYGKSVLLQHLASAYRTRGEWLPDGDVRRSAARYSHFGPGIHAPTGRGD